MELEEIAKQTAKEHGLDPALVCAVCEQESGDRKPDPVTHKETWDPWAVRFEPGFYRKYIHPANPDKPTTEQILSAASFGLMQIMGETAQEFGFQGKFLTCLCDPYLGIEMGCRKLKRCLDKHPESINAALLAYNGGGNDKYDDEVLARVAKYR